MGLLVKVQDVVYLLTAKLAVTRIPSSVIRIGLGDGQFGSFRWLGTDEEQQLTAFSGFIECARTIHIDVNNSEAVSSST